MKRSSSAKRLRTIARPSFNTPAGYAQSGLFPSGGNSLPEPPSRFLTQNQIRRAREQLILPAWQLWHSICQRLVRQRRQLDLDCIARSHLTAGNDDAHHTCFPNQALEFSVHTKLEQPRLKAIDLAAWIGNAVIEQLGLNDMDLPEIRMLTKSPDVEEVLICGSGRRVALNTTADFARSALGVSPDAWRSACETMGDHQAAIVVSPLLQRSERVRSPGGHLRSLTNKARDGHFRLGLC